MTCYRDFVWLLFALLELAWSSSLLQIGSGATVMRARAPTSEGAPQAFQNVLGERKTCSTAATSAGFTQYMRSHRRAYVPGSQEFLERKGLFMARMQEAQHHNCKDGKRLWIAGPTSLSDRTENELARLLGFKPARISNGQSIAGIPEAQVRFHALVSNRPQVQSWPKQNFSWTNLKAAQNVLDQGACGSCWAAGTVLMLNAHTSIYGKYRAFSLQQLVSCVPNPQSCGGRGGCNGSTGELALDYVMHNGLEPESTFPYEGRDMPCPNGRRPRNLNPIPHPSSSKNVNFTSLHLTSAPSLKFGMVGWSKLPSNRLSSMFRALYQEGPVAVSVVVGMQWSMYQSGILDDCSKNNMKINHLVVLMGYGEDKKLAAKYWQLQNSWGTEWGEKGHLRMIRLDDQKEAEFCGWNTDPQIGTGCEGGPSKVWTCGSCGILYDGVVPHFEGETALAKEMAKRRNLSSR